ncbi:MAG: glycosyltransferase [Alcanivorax sp.]|nr:glycosyltransferase [Alcanivorax sp.]
MKVLFLVQAKQKIILDRLYDAIESNCDCDTRWLDANEQKNLKKYFRDHVNVNKYDRIMVILRSKKIMRQARFCRSIPNLVFLEHDAWQNYAQGKYFGRFSRLYKKVPGARVISSGYCVSKRLKDEGVDCCFVSKGYDQELLADKGVKRDLQMAFVGSLENDIYKERKAFLSELVAHLPVKIMKTKSGGDYCDTLNRIKYFISADVGFREYMIKNFEAMACGCLLFAWNQGDEENGALGFSDMENVVLYSSLDELKKKIKIIDSDPELYERIRLAGKKLVENNYRFDLVGKRVVNCLAPEIEKFHQKKTSFWK